MQLKQHAVMHTEPIKMTLDSNFAVSPMLLLGLDVGLRDALKFKTEDRT